MKNKILLLILISFYLNGCIKPTAEPKLKKGDVVVTKIDNRTGIIMAAFPSIRKDKVCRYLVRFPVKQENVITKFLYIEHYLYDYEIELKGEK